MFSWEFYSTAVAAKQIVVEISIRHNPFRETSEC